MVWTRSLSRRFGLLIDPLDMTGLCGSQCEPNWLVTVSGSQGSSCGGFPAYPAVLPAANRPTCVRRQGDTLRTRLEACQRVSRTFSGRIDRMPMTGSGNRNAPRIHREAADGATSHLGSRRVRYCLVSRLPLVFNTHAPCLRRLIGGAVLYCTSAQPETQALIVQYSGIVANGLSPFVTSGPFGACTLSTAPRPSAVLLDATSRANRRLPT